MNVDNFFNVFLGFGLLLFSLRYLSTSLAERSSQKISIFLEKKLRSGWSFLFSGCLVTILIQASNVTIISTMGLLNKGSILALEEGILIMLGATVGTTIKGWFFTQLGAYLGPFVIGLCGLLYIVVKKNIFKKALEIALAIGFIFIGLKFVVLGLAPLANNLKLLTFLGLDSKNYSSFFWIATIGLLLAIIFQSSSTVLILALTLVQENILPLQVAMSLLLGANIGTTSTALIVSVNQSRDAKRLALSHFLIKCGGVTLCLIFFKSFLALVNFPLQLIPKHSNTLFLTFGHMGFNLLNALFWWMLLPLLKKIILWIIPYKKKNMVYLAYPSIRRLLLSVPKKAVSEAQKGIHEILGHFKWLLEYYASPLTGIETPNKFFSHSGVMEEKNVKWNCEQLLENLQKLLYNLLSNLPPTGKEYQKTADLLHQVILLKQVYSSLSGLGEMVASYVIEDQLALEENIRIDFVVQIKKITKALEKNYQLVTKNNDISINKAPFWINYEKWEFKTFKAVEKIKNITQYVEYLLNKDLTSIETSDEPSKFSHTPSFDLRSHLPSTPDQ